MIVPGDDNGQSASKVDIEVGGPFPLETSWTVIQDSDPVPVNLRLFRESKPYWTTEFLTARNAINALIFSRRLKRVYLPSYLCDSVRLSIKSVNSNVEVKQYSCNPIHLPESNPSKFNGLLGRSAYTSKLEFPLEKLSNSLIVVPDYFGFGFQFDMLHEYHEHVKSCGGLLLRDLTQSMFRIPECCDYAVYSFRKSIGVPNGSLLVSYTEEEKITSTPSVSLAHRSSFMQQLGMSIGALLGKGSAFFQQSEGMLNFLSNDMATVFSKPSEITTAVTNLMSYSTLAQMRAARRRNYSALRQRLNSIALTASISRDSETVPLGLPVLVHNRDMVLEYLYRRKIYPIVHWRGMDDRPTVDKAISCSIITIPCDHRYTEDHMKILSSHVMNAVREYGR